jgi:hypothetical protein
MPRSKQTVRVRPVPGEPGVYSVESWSDPEHPYKVVLFSDGPLPVDKGLPECHCINFVTKRRPARRLGASGYFGDGACRHIVAVLRYELLQRLQELAKKQ